MTEELGEYVQIPIERAACLVLFELLTDSYAKWRAENPDDLLAAPMVVTAAGEADRRALWKLEGALERTLPELFSSNYQELLEAARGAISSH